MRLKQINPELYTLLKELYIFHPKYSDDLCYRRALLDQNVCIVTASHDYF